MLGENPMLIIKLKKKISPQTKIDIGAEIFHHILVMSQQIALVLTPCF